jgi:hypothetical protein
MSKIGQGLGEVHRKLHRMGNNRPHPHPDKTAGKMIVMILSWLNNFSVRLSGSLILSRWRLAGICL